VAKTWSIDSRRLEILIVIQQQHTYIRLRWNINLEPKLLVNKL